MHTRIMDDHAARAMQTVLKKRILGDREIIGD